MFHINDCEDLLLGTRPLPPSDARSGCHSGAGGRLMRYRQKSATTALRALSCSVRNTGECLLEDVIRMGAETTRPFLG